MPTPPALTLDELKRTDLDAYRIAHEALRGLAASLCGQRQLGLSQTLLLSCFEEWLDRGLLKLGVSDGHDEGGALTILLYDEDHGLYRDVYTREPWGEPSTPRVEPV